MALLTCTATFRSVASFHHGYTNGSDFPHSKQNSSERDVNPQDGHIVCDPKQSVCGLLRRRADVVKVLNERVTKVGSVPKRGQSGRKTGSMGEPSFLSVAQRTVAEGVNV